MSRTRLVALAACCGLALAAVSSDAWTQAPNTSALWGEKGELWAGPAGRLPDYSYAGYRRGEEPIPYLPVTSNVKLDFGAKGDGVTDDTQAFKNAFANAPNGALLIPAGKYILSDSLRIKRSNFVLRGVSADVGGTELHFTQPLNTLKPWGTAYWNQGKGGMLVVGSSNIDGDKTMLGPKLGNVILPAYRGDTELVVGNTGGMKAGDTVYLEQKDDSAGSMNWYLNNGLHAGGTCFWDPSPLDWPVQIAAVAGNVVTLAQPLRFDVRMSWKPAFYEFVEYSEFGIEDLRITFPPHAYPGHHLELGYNAIAFEGMLNSWIQDVTLVDFDNGILLEFSKNCVIRDVTLQKGLSQLGTKDFHHGIWFNRSSADNLLEDFRIGSADGVHDVSVSDYASGNVIRDGRFQNGKLDHHQGAPFANLFSDLHMGAAPTYIWTSGGGSCGSDSYSGFHSTYWNLTSSDPSWVGPTGLISPNAPPWKKLRTNVVPGRWDNKTPDHEWLEVVDALTPSDLYASQLALRLGISSEVTVLGPSCSSTGQPVLLTVGEPKLGQALAFSVDGGPALAFALPLVGKPLPAALPLGGGCLLFVDPAKLISAPIGTTDAAGRWNGSVSLPNDTSILGATYALQVMLVGGQAPNTNALSGGVAFTVGN